MHHSVCMNPVILVDVDIRPSPLPPSSKGLLKYVHLYDSYKLFDLSVRPGTYSVRHLLDMRLLDATCILYTKHL